MDWPAGVPLTPSPPSVRGVPAREQERLDRFPSQGVRFQASAPLAQNAPR